MISDSECARSALTQTSVLRRQSEGRRHADPVESSHVWSFNSHVPEKKVASGFCYNGGTLGLAKYTDLTFVTHRTAREWRDHSTTPRCVRQSGAHEGPATFSFFTSALMILPDSMSMDMCPWPSIITSSELLMSLWLISANFVGISSGLPW